MHEQWKHAGYLNEFSLIATTFNSNSHQIDCTHFYRAYFNKTSTNTRLKLFLLGQIIKHPAIGGVTNGEMVAGVQDGDGKAKITVVD